MKGNHREHIETRNKLKEISTYKTFKNILDEVILTDEEKKILTMIYIDEIKRPVIAYELGISESTLNRKHSKILKKIGKVIL